MCHQSLGFSSLGCGAVAAAGRPVDKLSGQNQMVEKKVFDEAGWFGVDHGFDEGESAHGRDEGKGEVPRNEDDDRKDTENGENAEVFQTKDYAGRLGDDGRGGDGQVGFLTARHVLFTSGRKSA